MPQLIRSAALVGLLTAGAPRQNVPITMLSKPAAEFPEGFANLSSPRELPDGRVLVIETCERIVKLLDLASGTASQVGRTGSGPGEYRIPSSLYAMPADSSALLDPANNRLLMIHPDGKPGRMFSAPPAVTRTLGRGVVSSRFFPTGVDQQGRFYARTSGLSVNQAGTLVRPDSSAIERWDPRSDKRDTITMLPVLVNPGPVNLTRMNPPFGVGIQWATAVDGRVGFVDPRDYHVEFISSNGTRTAGRSIPYSRLKLSESHKREWRDDQKPDCPITFPGGVSPIQQEITWPEYLPPFLSGAASFAPDGLLWVRRTTPADAPPTYDLIDDKGSLVHRVHLAKRSKLLGFGRQSVYVVRLDEDDLQYLQRFPLPAAVKP